ncbi:MAG: hypothetical protein BGO76_08545 [Caedibacter sp. 38-128]|nr:helix-turn-helix transcriptional regulator [Holosporales bacterium]OJX08103.1 MAG: hypothetical protein BGO76_08545 [Caedibacter sp. 38-128]
MESLIIELREIRKKKSMTQIELARHVGLPQSHISAIEQGKIDLRVSTLIQIARILDHEVTLVPRPLDSFVKVIIKGKEDADIEPRFQPDDEID